MVSLLRPRQWVKNGIVLVAPAAAVSSHSLHPIPIAATVAAFIAASSLVYVLNDWVDRERDRLHPEKRHRPLASGKIGPMGAALLAGVCATILAAGLLLVPMGARLVIACYLALNLAYSFGLKHQPLVDVSIVAAGFGLRAAAGSISAGVPPDSDLLICVYFSCLLLGLGKRRHELAAHLQSAQAPDHRPALRQYSIGLLDSLMMVSLAATLVGYFLFVQNGATFDHPLVATLTLPFAVFAGARYLQLVVVHGTGGEPSRDLTRDRPMLLNAMLWLGILIIGVST